MSSAINHRRRSHKCYEKRVSAMNTFQRKALVKEHQQQGPDNEPVVRQQDAVGQSLRL